MKKAIDTVSVVRANASSVLLKWALYGPLLEESFPGGWDDHAGAAVMAMIADERIQVFDVLDADGAMVGVVAVTMVQEFAGEPKRLTIWAIKVNPEVSRQAYVDAMERLKTYARENGCKEVVAWTEKATVARMMARIGFSKPRIYMSMEA